MIKGVFGGMAIGFLTIALSGWALGQSRFDTGPFPTELDYFNAKQSSTSYISGESALGLVKAVELAISDQVDGGCWTEASAARARIKAELERSGVAVYEEALAFTNQFAPFLTLTVLGYRIGESGPCIATAKMDVRYFSNNQLGSLSMTGRVFGVSGLTLGWSQISIFNEQKNLNGSVMSFVQESLDELVAGIYRGRRDEEVVRLFEVWHYEEPMTKSEWDAKYGELAE